MKIIEVKETEKHGFTMTVQNKGIRTNMPIPLETFLALAKMGVKDADSVEPWCIITIERSGLKPQTIHRRSPEECEEYRRRKYPDWKTVKTIGRY